MAACATMVTSKKPQAAKKRPTKKPAAKAAAADSPLQTAKSRERKLRQIFKEGHKRKFLVVVDETPECESALAFAASRTQRTHGQLALLYVIEPGVDFQHWLGVEEIAREEGHAKAKAVFRLFGRKLKAMGFDKIVPEEIVREGVKAEEITKLTEEDEDIGVLVLGASKDPSGPGPLVASLAGGRLIGTFPVPITVVPGHLTTEEILALA
jgi:nucleotide-binding universal stress UspA family protein